MKKTANGAGIVLSSLLSALLCILLLTVPVVSALCSFTQTQTIHKVIKDIDFVQLVAQHEELRTTLEKYGIDGNFLDGITETELVEELVDAYVQSIFEGKAFDPYVVEGIILSHKQDAIDLFRRLAEEHGSNAANLTDEEFFAQILNAVRTEWEQIIAVLPSAEDMGLTQQDYEEWASAFGKALHAPVKLRGSTSFMTELVDGTLSLGRAVLYLRAGTPVKAVTVLIAIVSLLILLLRWPRFKGFLWLCVVYLLSAALTAVGAGALSNLTLDVEGIVQFLLKPVLSVFTSEMNRCAILTAVLGVIFLTVFILGKVVLSGNHQKTAPQLEVNEPAEVTELVAAEPAAEEDSLDDLLRRAEVFEE